MVVEVQTQVVEMSGMGLLERGNIQTLHAFSGFGVSIPNYASFLDTPSLLVALTFRNLEI